MDKKKTKISVIVSSIILMLVLVINIGITFAWYSDHKHYSNNIDFGYIKIDVNNSATDGYFSNTDNYYNSIKPGDYLLRKDVRFNLKSGSDPAYIRAKYDVSISGKNLLKIAGREIVSTSNGYGNNTVRDLNGNRVYIGLTRNNYWYPNNITDYSIADDGSNVTLTTTTPGYGISFDYLCKPNTTYTLSHTETTEIGVGYFSADGTYLNKHASLAQKSLTFTTPANCYKILLTCVVSGSYSNLQLEEGAAATSYEPYKTTYTEDERNVYKYLKYKDLELGENLFDAQKFVDNAISLGYNSSQISVNKNYRNAINFGQIAYSQNYTKLNIDCAENVTYTFSCDIDTTNLQSNAVSGFRIYYTDGTYDTIELNKSTTSLSLTSKSGKTVSGIGSSGWSYSGSFIAYNIKLQQTTYHWSEKRGEYYYLLGSDDLPLAIDKTTEGYYTFLTKENSQIDYSLDYDATNVNKNDINVNITIEAIQVPSVTQTIDGVESVLNELNEFTKPSDNYRVTFVYGDNKTVSTGNITYGGNAGLPGEVTGLVSKGFSLWDGGLKIIGENGNNHSYIKNGKICNVTENLILYEASEITLYNVTFVNGTDTMQTNKVISGKYAEYLGKKPTKTATDKVYTFVGWSKTENGEVVTLSTEKITQDTTFYAVFTDKPKTYKINYNLDGGIFKTTPSTTISSGNENLLNFANLEATLDPSTGNLYYSQHGTNCRLEAKTYTLSFDYNFTLYNNENVGLGIGLGASNLNASYCFDIKSIDDYTTFPQGRKVFTFTPLASDLVGHDYLALRLIRSDKPLSNQIIAYFSNFKLEEGNVATAYEHYGARILPTNNDVYKNGYVLEGWYTDGAFTNKVTSLNNLTGDTTLYAKWVMATCGVETTSGVTYYDNLTEALKYAVNYNDSKIVIYKNNSNNEIDCYIEDTITIPSGKTLTIVSNGTRSIIGLKANIINNGTLIIGGKTGGLNNLTFKTYMSGIESSGNLTIYGGNFERVEKDKSLITTTGGSLKVLGGTFEDLVVDSTNSFINLANTVANISDATMKNENTTSQTMIKVTENSDVTFDGETKLLNPYGCAIETSQDETKSNANITINNGTFNGVVSIRTNNVLTFNNGLIKQTHHALGIYNMGQFNMNGGELLSDYNIKLSYTFVYALYNYSGNAIINGGKITVNAYQSLSDLQYGYCAIMSAGNITINNVNLTCDLKNSESRIFGIYLQVDKTSTINNGNFVLKGVESSTKNYLINQIGQNTLNIYDGEFTNNINGLAFSNGTTNIYGGNFNVVTSIYISANSNMNILGGTFTSEQNLFDLSTTGTLNIDDGTFTSGSDSTNKLAVMKVNSGTTNVNVVINGGTFNGDYILLNESSDSKYNATINKGILNASVTAIYSVGSSATVTLNGGIIKSTKAETPIAIYINDSAITLNNASITGNIYYETKTNLINVSSNLNGSYIISFKDNLFSLGDEVIIFSSNISAKTYKNNFSLTESMTGYILYPSVSDDSLCLSRYFNVTFANDDGTILRTESVPYGEVPTYNGATPTKESDEDYIYTFSGWNQEFSKVTEDVTYYAQYSVEPYYVTLPEASTFKNALNSTCGFNYNTITSLTFSNSIPTGYTKSLTQLASGIDVYYNNTDKSVMLVTKGGILAPSDSASLFNGFSALKEIKFNGVLSTKNATNMNDMFVSCTLLEQLDLSSFETNNLNSFNNMFYNCSNLKSVNMSNFIIPSEKTFTVFSGCSSLETIYAPKAIGSDTTIDLPTSAIWGIEGNNTLITSMTSEVAGKKLVVAGYELASDWQTKVTWSEVGELTNGVTSISEISFERTAPTGYNPSGKKINNIDIYANGTKVAFVSNKQIYAPSNSSKLFGATEDEKQLKQLENITFNNFDTRNSTNTSYMFYGCSGLSSLDLSTFDTSKATIMNDMFVGCSNLTSINLKGKFNTSNATIISWMFANCNKLTSIDLSNFETDKVTNFGGIFSGCSVLEELDLSSFNFSSATNLSSMFNSCSSLTNIKVDWSTTNNGLTTTSSMFSGCSSLKQLDLRTLNTSGVTNFNSMFSGCSSLQDLDLSNFVISVTSADAVENMLLGCTNLVRIIAPSSIGVAINLPGTYYINGTGTGVTSITTSDAGKIFVNQKEDLTS